MRPSPLRKLLRRRLFLLIASVFPLLPAPAAPAEAPRLHVFAAASLSEAVDAVIDAWRGRAVGVYGGSSTLARQIELGGPADVFISANPDWVAHLVAVDALRGAPVDIASNALVAIGAPGIASPLSRLKAGEAGRLAIADPISVPAGIYARQALTALGLWEGQRGLLIGASVREALAWVSRGEAEVGVVYRTDALLAPGLAMEEIDTALHAPIRYVAAVVATARPEAEAFLAFLLGPEAQAILAERGFAPPISAR